jgi:hypothetical protein
MYVKERCQYGLDLTGSSHGPVTDCCVHGNEYSPFIK